jgi:acyl-CoA thioester hydrolase
MLITDGKKLIFVPWKSKIYASTMIKHEETLRVRYGETDQMGFVYYGNYALYFEVARVEALRSLGISYAQLEKEGVLLPVYEFTTKYLKPANYDDMLTIKCVIPVLPKGRITFEYETLNEAGDLLNVATVVLVFVDKATGRPTKPPEKLIDKMAPYFS